MALAVEAAEVPVEDFVASARRDAASRRLTSAAIEAAADTSYVEKLGAIADSLARGLTADGRPDVDQELLVIDALGEMEPSHVWLLDRVARWAPLTGSIIAGEQPPHGEAISVVPEDQTDPLRHVDRARWARGELSAGFARHKRAAIFEPVLQSFLRLGVLVIEPSALNDDRREDVGTPILTTEFGLDVHSRLLSSGAVDDAGWGTSTLGFSAHGLTAGSPTGRDSASTLTSSASDPRSSRPGPPEPGVVRGHRVESNRPPGTRGTLARVVRQD